MKKHQNVNHEEPSSPTSHNIDQESNFNSTASSETKKVCQNEESCEIKKTFLNEEQ